jgi:hypothetical protein
VEFFARAVITFPKAERDKLIALPSARRSPDVLAYPVFSDPARSTKLISEVV